MQNAVRPQLERFGLSASEAEIYLALLHRGGALGATALAGALGVQRTAVYPVLTSLAQKGMVEAGAGYGSRFTAVPPGEALSFLVTREREELSQRERLAKEELSQRERLAGELAKKLESLASPADHDEETEVVQVFRDGRVAGERFQRLQLEAKRQLDVLVKFPVFDPSRGNPAQEKALRRGVRYRVIYERAVIDAPEIKPYLSRWIALGEEARVHEGELPHKLALFDQQNILLPLVMPGGQNRTLFIRHTQLAMSLGMLFDSLWERASPLHEGRSRKVTARTKSSVGRSYQGRDTRNGEGKAERRSQ